MLLKFITVILGLSLNNFKIPPLGAIYNKNLNLPFIGNQYIETEYINNNTARIQLTGLINQNGTS